MPARDRPIRRYEFDFDGITVTAYTSTTSKLWIGHDCLTVEWIVRPDFQGYRLRRELGDGRSTTSDHARRQDAIRAGIVMLMGERYAGL